MMLKRLLVPVDFSADSLHALAEAHDLAARFGAGLILLHVVEPVYIADPAVSTETMMLVEERAGIAAHELARIAAGMRRRPRIHTLVLRGAPAQVIVETAARCRVDLIVMGTHGRTGMAPLLIGSVAEKVIRTARCPVLTVRRCRDARRTKRSAPPQRLH